MAKNFRNLLGTMVDLHRIIAVGRICERTGLGSYKAGSYFDVYLEHGVEITISDPDEDAVKTCYVTLSTLLTQLT